MTHYCFCGAAIDPDRFDAGFTTCIQHGDKYRHAGFMIFDHKTAPRLAIVPVRPGTEEPLRLAHRANRRSR